MWGPGMNVAGVINNLAEVDAVSSVFEGKEGESGAGLAGELVMNVLNPFSSCSGGSLGRPCDPAALCSIGGRYRGSHCFVDESYNGCLSGPFSSKSALGTTGRILSGNQ